MIEKLQETTLQYFDPDAAEEMLKDAASPKKLTEREICFVLIALCPENEADVEQMHEPIADMAIAHCGFVDSIVSHFAVVCFGFIPDSSTESHKPFVVALRAKFGGAIKIAYATGVAQMGDLGGGTRWSYSFIHPAFPRVLAELTDMPPGEAHEIV